MFFAQSYLYRLFYSNWHLKLNSVTLCRLKWVFSSIDTFIPCIRFQITWACPKLGCISNPLVSNCKKIKKVKRYCFYVKPSAFPMGILFKRWLKFLPQPWRILKPSTLYKSVQNFLLATGFRMHQKVCKTGWSSLLFRPEILM